VGSRIVPFDPNDVCDICGKKGANDFMGHMICDECIDTDEDGYIIGASKKPLPPPDGA
jgi:hypothetical protein